jgi:hypothetical protein
VMTHEYGHAIDSVAAGTWMMLEWSPELRADAWAGCALANLKLNPRSLGAVLTGMSLYPSKQAPVWNVRPGPLRAGYGRCGAVGDFDKGAATVTAPTKKK